MNSIVITAIIGVILSIYAYYVEKKHEKNANYKAFCDISDKASCSVAFSSKYGKLIGISNSLLGIIFYLLVIVLFYTYKEFIIYLAILSILCSIYLAYIQYAKIKNFCLVCTTIYLVNILLLIFSL